METKASPALKIGLVITILIVLSACVVLSGLGGLLLMSATPQMMPVRWTMMCLSPVGVIALLSLGVFAYLNRKVGILYAVPIVLLIYLTIIVTLFTNLGPDQ